jgi:hypothetical protein
MEPENLTLRILGEMREEMREMRQESATDIRELKADVRSVKDHLGVVDQRLAVVDQRLGVIEDTMLDVASQVHVLGRATRVTLDAKKRHEALIADIDRRVTELERQRGEG